MQVYKGINALSPFQAKKLLSTLRQTLPNITSIDAEFVHFVKTEALSTDDKSRLEQLLTYDSPYKGKRAGEQFIVVPRLGTISPWSSKATDIVRNSGLTQVLRVERGIIYYVTANGSLDRKQVNKHLHDRMTEVVLGTVEAAEALFETTKPRPYQEVDVLGGGEAALVAANKTMGLAITDDEVAYLHQSYKELGRNPTDAELMMFAQVNSEHCRHKIFNADWVVDGKPQPKSLFKMIKNTYEKAGEDVLSAYSDNAAVLRGQEAQRFFADTADHTYRSHQEPVHTVIKVETHNHPTAIAPFPGAATGSGGEIRDESATGRGAKPKMGLTGFTVSNLCIEGVARPWEKAYGKPDRTSSAYDIMVQAPLGGAAFNNEYGRPNLQGYFRTYEQVDEQGKVWGYHKPIMIAGGLGMIRDGLVDKQQLKPGAKLIVLGGPAMLIGLGGGAASSMKSGESHEDLDFASVQRANAEIQRRAQEVIDACAAMGADNPILTIHDIGAGGLSNGLPELVHDSGLGAKFELRDIPNAEPGMSPMEIWCNEAQERFVLAIDASNVALFEKLCLRERCPFAIVGETTKQEQLVVADRHFKNKPVDLPMHVLFGKPPKMTRTYKTTNHQQPSFDTKLIDLNEAVKRVLQLPAVGSKKFLITIGDRTVSGLVARDQMVGPWQVPVSDVAVTSTTFEGTMGEAMSMGERTPLALQNSAAAARMAVAEAVTNIAAAPIKKLSDIKLSANWMAAAGNEDQDQKLFEAVKAVGEDFCPELGITIPVGKDSLSMRSVWEEKGKQKSVTSPLSLIITAFAPVSDVTKTLTPQLQSLDKPTALIFIDLGRGLNRLGGSALAQVYNQIGNEVPDVDAPTLKNFFDVIQQLNKTDKLLAYHDRSDGGLFATLAEMSFASRSGLDIDLSSLTGDALAVLFSEEIGAVVQVLKKDVDAVTTLLNKAIGPHVHIIGRPAKTQNVVIRTDNHVYKQTRPQLETWWADTSYQMQKRRDNPLCADQELALITDENDTGLMAKMTFVFSRGQNNSRPKVAILRDQGVNGHVEMAAAFDRAGFTSVDVHINDLVQGTAKLSDFAGLAACGGFSYGDVLGAGGGWAKSVLFNPAMRQQFGDFFNRPDTFSLGVCNGCQMLSILKDLIPGAKDWPRFLRNASAQFEARLVTVKVNDSPSILLKGMTGSVLPIPVAHGEGLATFATVSQVRKSIENKLVPLQFVDSHGLVTETYPYNPNGSPQGITSLTTPDGRATIIMPHPERVFLAKQYSWHPDGWKGDGPWLKMFQNARQWVG